MKFTNVLIGILVCATSQIFSQWNNTNCSGSGPIYDMIETGGNLMVARGGVYSSPDGTNWSTVGTGATFGSCRTLKNFSGSLYAGYTGSNFYTSINNGTNWSSLAGKSGLASVYSTSLFKNANVLIYGINNGSGSTYYSTNNGTTWATSQYNYGSGSQQGFENTCYDIVELNGELFHSTYKNLFKSVNSGATWTVVATSPTISAGSVTSLCTINGGLLLSIYGNGVHRSIDGGNTWTKVLGGSLGTLTNNMTRVYYENGIAIAGGASGQVYLSTDNGVTWTDVSDTGIALGDVVQSIKFFDNNIYIGTNTALYKKPYSGVGVKEIEKLSFTILPNPSSDTISIEGIDNLSSITIKLHNIDGKLVSLFQNSDKLDVSNLSPGMYFITVSDKNGRYTTSKFIKE